jgi:hypothetical protein
MTPNMGMIQPGTGILNDRDIAQDLLTSEKYVTGLVGTGTLEASNPQVRQTLSQVHNETESSSRRIFDYLNARGWYNPRVADPQAVSDLRRTVDEASRDIHRSFSVTGPGPVPGYGVQPGYGGGYQVSSFSGQSGYGQGYAGYTTPLPSWAYQDPYRREDRGYGGYPTGGYGGYGTSPAGSSGYQASGFGGTLPSWAYQEPSRREDRGYSASGYQSGSYSPGYGGGYQGYGTRYS